MTLFDIDFGDVDEKQAGETPESICKGKIYRCRINAYISPTTGQYVRTERMVPMKRLSCPGCEKCGYLDEYMSEDLHCAGELAVEPDLEHGALYEFKITRQYRDWETGYVDDFEMAFVKVEDADHQQK